MTSRSFYMPYVINESPYGGCPINPPPLTDYTIGGGSPHCTRNCCTMFEVQLGGPPPPLYNYWGGSPPHCTIIEGGSPPHCTILFLLLITAWWCSCKTIFCKNVKKTLKISKTHEKMMFWRQQKRNCTIGGGDPFVQRGWGTLWSTISVRLEVNIVQCTLFWGGDPPPP